LKKLNYFTLLLLLTSSIATAQNKSSDAFVNDDLSVGSDIFQDFNEDLEASQVMEDERFYRYSRFFGVNIGLGLTTFTDNRGLAYDDNHPSLSFSLIYFLNFQNAFVIGIEYSKHTMILDTFLVGSPTEELGIVETNMLRPFIGMRYYIETTDLGTAITYSNPYFVGRVEYWYQTNTFPEREKLDDVSGGGIGTGVGFGLEFPIEIKKSYFNVEFLYHRVAFFDKYTSDYRAFTDEQVAAGANKSDYGYQDLRGDVISLMFNYNISW
jgi:hypothetical protein